MVAERVRHKAPNSIYQGAETPVYLIDLPYKMNKEFQGQFFYLKKVKPLTEL